MPDPRQIAILDRLPIGVYLSTPEGRILDANPAVIAMLGFPDRESFLATSVKDIYADPDQRARLLAQADRDGSLQGVEAQLRRRDGNLIWVRLNMFLERDPGGRPIFYAGTIEDVTERRLAEDALWESEARLKLLMEQLPAILWTTDLELRSTMSQGAGLASINLRPNELAGKTLFEYFQTTDPNHPTIAAHRRALAGEAVSYIQDWAGRSFEGHVRPLRSSEGSVIGVLGMSLDVTDRKRLEAAARERTEALRESEERHRQLYEKERGGPRAGRAPPRGDAGPGVDPRSGGGPGPHPPRAARRRAVRHRVHPGAAGRVDGGHRRTRLPDPGRHPRGALRREWGQEPEPRRLSYPPPRRPGGRAQGLSRFPRGEARHDPDQILDRNPPPVRRSVHRHAGSRQVRSGLLHRRARPSRGVVRRSRRHRDGKRAAVRGGPGRARGADAGRGPVPAVPEDGGGRTAGRRDRARLQQPARRDHRLHGPRGRAAAGGPPRPREARPGPQRRRARGGVDRAAPGLQPEAGAGAGRAGPGGGDRGPLGHAAPSHRGGHRAGDDRSRAPRSRARGPRPDRPGDPEPRRQRAGRDARWRQAGDRGEKRRPRGGRRRRTDLPAGGRLRHGDGERYGGGHEPDVVAQIFEPFFTTKEPGKGTGLGLSMVYGFLTQSGGHVSVFSAVGRGTTFKLYLPRLGDDVRPSRAPAPLAEPVGGSETVLVAEDADSLREMIAEILTASGYRVLEARTAEHALQVAQGHQGPIQLLLTDMVMPGMSGGDLANAVRGVRREARVLFMSGYTDDVMIQRGILPEEASLLQKPFASDALLRKVRETLDREA